MLDMLLFRFSTVTPSLMTLIEVGAFKRTFN